MGIVPKLIVLLGIILSSTGCDTRGCCGSASATSSGGGGGTGGSAGAPAPVVPPAGGTVTMSDGSGVITVTGMHRGVIHGPFLSGQDQYTLWDGLRKGPSEKFAVRPYVAGGYPGSSGWTVGAIVVAALLGTYTGNANVGSTAVRLPTPADDGSGGNTAFASFDGTNWLLAGWQDSAPANSNFATYLGTGTKYFWAANALKKF